MTAVLATAGASGRLLGGHLVHAVVFGSWGLAVVVVLLWPHDSAEHRADKERRGLVPTADRSWLQMAALGSFAAGATHGAVMPAHFRQSAAYGVFFLGAAAAQVALGVVLLTRPSPRLLTAALAGSLAVVALWAASRFWGVPVGPDHGAVEPVGVLDVLATVAELATAVGVGAVLRGGRPRPAWRWTWWGPGMRLAAFVLAAGVPVTAALVPRG
ncbi:MAG TPA: hypothetical protein VE991_07675 [Acidimicrobiales bacterium]|nr:hypothetical protein [Acidimicrobiales bacterium]